jgi:hypothetical protein
MKVQVIQVLQELRQVGAKALEQLRVALHAEGVARQFIVVLTWS